MRVLRARRVQPHPQGDNLFRVGVSIFISSNQSRGSYEEYSYSHPSLMRNENREVKAKSQQIGPQGSSHDLQSLASSKSSTSGFNRGVVELRSRVLQGKSLLVRVYLSGLSMSAWILA